MADDAPSNSTGTETGRDYRPTVFLPETPFPMRAGIVYLVEPEKAFSMTLPFEHTPAG